MPCGDIFAARRDRSFGWGYGHIPPSGATVAVGAGPHVAAYFIEQQSELSTTGTVLCVAIPVTVYVVGIFLLYSVLTRSFDPFHLLLMAGSALLVAAAVVLAEAGLSMEWCIAVLALTPWVTVVGYELVGHRHNAEVLTGI